MSTGVAGVGALLPLRVPLLLTEVAAKEEEVVVVVVVVVVDGEDDAAADGGVELAAVVDVAAVGLLVDVEEEMAEAEEVVVEVEVEVVVVVVEMAEAEEDVEDVDPFFCTLSSRYQASTACVSVSSSPASMGVSRHK
jgi:hypothetical protein